MRAFVLAALVLASAACRRADVYPAGVVENFMRECTMRSDKRVCRCALDALQRRFTLEEFNALETRARTGQPPQELLDAVGGCRG